MSDPMADFDWTYILDKRNDSGYAVGPEDEPLNPDEPPANIADEDKVELVAAEWRERAKGAEDWARRMEVTAADALELSVAELARADAAESLAARYKEALSEKAASFEASARRFEADASTQTRGGEIRKLIQADCYRQAAAELHQLARPSALTDSTPTEEER